MELIHGFVSLVIAAAGAFFQVNTLTNNENWLLWRGLRCFPVNVVRRPQIDAKLCLYVLRNLDFQTLFLIQENKSHWNNSFFRWEFKAIRLCLKFHSARSLLTLFLFDIIRLFIPFPFESPVLINVPSTYICIQPNTYVWTKDIPFVRDQEQSDEPF